MCEKIDSYWYSKAALILLFAGLYGALSFGASEMPMRYHFQGDHKPNAGWVPIPRPTKTANTLHFLHWTDLIRIKSCQWRSAQQKHLISDRYQPVIGSTVQNGKSFEQDQFNQLTQFKLLHC